MRLGDIAFDQQQIGRVAEFGGGLLQAGEGAGVADDIVAALKVSLGDGETQAARGAGYDDSLGGVHGQSPVGQAGRRASEADFNLQSGLEKWRVWNLN
ncbi:hypothetical protein D3C84_1067810 [compost metagenome]